MTYGYYPPSNGYSYQPPPAPKSSEWPTGLIAMRKVVLLGGVILAISSILFEISQMDNSILSLAKTPWVGYAYWLMLLIPIYACFAIAYFAAWLSSVRGKNLDKPKFTWLLVGSVAIVLGRIAWMIVSSFWAYQFG